MTHGDPHEKTDFSENHPQIFTFVDQTYVLLVREHLLSLMNIYLFSVLCFELPVLLRHN